jgi:hypothetical protein
MAIRTVVTRGYGAGATIGLVTTRGYGTAGEIPPEPEPEVTTAQPGGFLPYAKGERRARGLEWDKRKPVDELVQEAYDRLHGDLRPAADAAEVREAVAEHAQASDAPIPPPAAIDFAGLAADLRAAQALLAAYERALQRKAEMDDEDDMIEALLLS